MVRIIRLNPDQLSLIPTSVSVYLTLSIPSFKGNIDTSSEVLLHENVMRTLTGMQDRCCLGHIHPIGILADLCFILQMAFYSLVR